MPAVKLAKVCCALVYVLITLVLHVCSSALIYQYNCCIFVVASLSTSVSADGWCCKGMDSCFFMLCYGVIFC